MFRGTLQQQTYEQRPISAMFNWEWSVDNLRIKGYLKWILKVSSTDEIKSSSQEGKIRFEVRRVEFRGIFRLYNYGNKFPFSCSDL